MNRMMHSVLPARGRGAKIFRASTGTSDSASGQRNLTGFDSVGFLDSGFVVSVAQGTITVPRDGWYMGDAHARFSAQTTSQNSVVDIYSNTLGASVVRGTQTTSVALEVGASGILYAQAGSTFVARIFTGSSTALVGNSAGSYYLFQLVAL